MNALQTLDHQPPASTLPTRIAKSIQHPTTALVLRILRPKDPIVVTLTPDDFHLETDRRIFRSMQTLQSRGEHIDRVPVADELARRGELGSDDRNYLLYLDDGIPQIPHIDSYVDIIRQKSTLRQHIGLAKNLTDECLLNVKDPTKILDFHLGRIEVLRGACSEREKIDRVEDLESIFVRRVPTEYMIKPELPLKAIVCLTGHDGDGFTIECSEGWTVPCYTLQLPHGPQFLALFRCSGGYAAEQDGSLNGRCREESSSHFMPGARSESTRNGRAGRAIGGFQA
jgi:hypothetical protein